MKKAKPEMLAPLKSDSLKDMFIARFERLILSGELALGQKLPPERELAGRLGVSRPVVHEGLVDLAAKGLVTMTPRVGTVVNDYRKEGSLALLTSLINFHEGRLDPNLFKSMVDMRMLFEVEIARLAALHRTGEQIETLRTILSQEKEADVRDAETITALDFDFHHTLAIATGNLFYPLLLNSFRPVYTNPTGQFFTDPAVAAKVFGFHGEMVEAVEQKDSGASTEVMRRMLEHGHRHLLKIAGGGTPRKNAGSKTKGG